MNRYERYLAEHTEAQPVGKPNLAEMAEIRFLTYTGVTPPAVAPRGEMMVVYGTDFYQIVFNSTTWVRVP